jgi:hypothetical protein
MPQYQLPKSLQELPEVPKQSFSFSRLFRPADPLPELPKPTNLMTEYLGEAYGWQEIYDQEIYDNEQFDAPEELAKIQQ